jgi:hypothetical protein
MHPRFRKINLVAASLILTGSVAHAQIVPPFFSPVGTAFTPEIGVVNTGLLHDAQAVVSADRKYVTITMGATIAGLLALREFSFQQGGGFAPAANRPGVAAVPGAAAPIEVTILDRTGITRIE